MFETIQSRIVAIFLGFVLLLATGVASSYVILQQQADDGLVVNLAGRQRMLTQKMTKESGQLAAAASSEDPTRINQERDQLSQTVRVFESTLLALKDGGSAPTNLAMTRMRETPRASTPEIQKQLGVVASLWKPFKGNIDKVLASSGTNSSALSAVMNQNEQLLGEMNKAVMLMQKDSERKVSMLYVVQSAALALGLLLVGVGIWIARSTIAKPIAELTQAAATMSTGDLNVEFSPTGTREVQELGASFDRMRSSMIAAFGTAGGGGVLADDDI